MVFSISRYTFVSMEAKELRIGNYVQLIPDNKRTELKDRIIRVDRIDEIGVEQLSITLLKVSRDFGASYEMIEGIPLTEEILLKCGFEENYRSKTRVNYDHKDFMFIGYDINLSGIDNMATGLRYYGSHIKIVYLHDLQNAFKAFTGEELIYTP